MFRPKAGSAELEVNRFQSTYHNEDAPSPIPSPPETLHTPAPRPRARYRIVPKFNSATSIFRLMDTNNSGYINREQLQHGLMDAGVTMADVGLELHATLDTNNDGRVSEQEFFDGYQLYCEKIEQNLESRHQESNLLRAKQEDTHCADTDASRRLDLNESDADTVQALMMKVTHGLRKNKVSPKQLYQLMDPGHTNSVDFNQFVSGLRLSKTRPALRREELHVLFWSFKENPISFKTFMDCWIYALALEGIDEWTVMGGICIGYFQQDGTLLSVRSDELHALVLELSTRLFEEEQTASMVTVAEHHTATREKASSYFRCVCCSVALVFQCMCCRSRQY